MLFALLHGFIALVLDVLAAFGVAANEKDLEIALLRQHLRIVERKANAKPRLSRPEKLMLVALADRFRRVSQRLHNSLGQYVLLVKPDTLLKWHRDLVRRKWTFQRPNLGGRPRIEAELEALIVRLARENPRLGFDKIQGELLKLGYAVDRSTVRNVMQRHHLSPVPKRGRSSWCTFLNHYRAQMLACDFFTIETVTLQTLYVLFFIELGSRRVHLAGCTAAPDSAWVAQQARQLMWKLNDEPVKIPFLIHDHDTKFSAAFNNVFVSEGLEIVLTPLQAPHANPALRDGVRSVREECLDHLLILNQRHLWNLLAEYTAYYNAARPHQGLAQQTPLPLIISQEGRVCCHDVLGGVIHDYYRQAA